MDRDIRSGAWGGRARVLSDDVYREVTSETGNLEQYGLTTDEFDNLCDELEPFLTVCSESDWYSREASAAAAEQARMNRTAEERQHEVLTMYAVSINFMMVMGGQSPLRYTT